MKASSPLNFVMDFYLDYSYESIIATLCESLDTLDEPEAKVLMFLFLLKNSFTAQNFWFCFFSC